jgi:pimeloyl-ACP methyl ester carboxylesterase
MTKTRNERPADPEPGAMRDAWDAIAGSVRRNPGLTAAAGAMAALAGVALFNRNRSNRAEADNPPIGNFVEVDGVRLHYVDRGEGRPIVLLHGNGAMIEDWQASGVLDRAAAGYRVIAFDRPGFGHSERPRTTIWTPAAQAALIHAALLRIGVERPVVVGHSWGTLVALAMALDFPQDVSGLVLVSGYYFPTVRGDVAVFSPPALPLVGDVMRLTVGPVVGRLATPLMSKAIFAPMPVAESFAAFPIEMSLRPSQIRATSADTAMMVPSAALLSARYGDLALPVEIVAGDGDVVAYCDRHAERLHDQLGGSGLTVIPGAGHMVHYAAPDEVVAAIRRASERAAPSAGAGRGDDIVPPAGAADF